MRIIDKNKCVNEIVQLIRDKAKYQKVVFCIDETSNMEVVDNIIGLLGKNIVSIKYFYNHKTISTFFNMANNGVRIIVYNVKVEYFYKLQTDNNFILNVFIPQESFMLPYMENVESVYGDNLLVCNNEDRDNLSILFMYYQGLNLVWNNLLQKSDIDTTIFKKIDFLTRCNSDFYIRLLEVYKQLGGNVDGGYKEVNVSQLSNYLYLRLCAMLKLFEHFTIGFEKCIDFDKESLSSKEVCKAYDLIVKHDIVDVIKFNSSNLIKLTSVILNRFKILIKKCFSFKCTELKKINKLIKMQSRYYNIDNLLYISYIFDTI